MSCVLSPAQRAARAAVAAHESWARTTNRSARTAAAREGRWRRYLQRARELQGPDATAEQVEQAAEHLRLADLARMGLASGRARRGRAAGRRESGVLDGEAAAS